MPEEEKDLLFGVPEFTPHGEAGPVKMSEVAGELGLDLQLVPAEDLAESGEAFIIRDAKPWVGVNDSIVYYCRCSYASTGEVFATNLGGKAVVDKLQRYFAAGPKAPVEVTLVENEGGRYGRYYTLE